MAASRAERPNETGTCAAEAPGCTWDARAADVLVLRHAPTTWNDERRRQGWADQRLTRAARSATRAWADRAPASFSTVVASDLRRARETAEIIAASLGLGQVETMAGLREQDQGAWTGLTKEQIKLQWPERLRERPRRPVGGESAEAVLGRVLVALGQVSAFHEGRCVLIVTHSGVIQTLERAAGVDAAPVPHLEGRWFRVVSRSQPAGTLAVPSLVAGRLTDGRQGLCGGAPAERSGEGK